MASSVFSTLLLLLLLLPLTFIPFTHSLLVPASPLNLAYHHGPLLAAPHPIKLSLTFYGDFEPSERSTLKAFLSSLNPSSLPTHHRSLRSSLFPLMEAPSVASWWSLTQHYTDLQSRHVSQRFELVEEVDDDYSLGKNLKASDIATLARNSVKFLSADRVNSLNLIFTSADVYVEGFCMHSCGGHSFTASAPEDGNPASGHEAELNPGYGGDANLGSSMVPYLWVGNPKLQCAGFCAWPFAKPQYGPPMEPMKAPNGIGVDGMIISLAKLLVGAATNPAGNAFYQGDDASFGLEAGGVCAGKFGAGSYPGSPGEVLRNPRTGASYNMEGREGVQFMVPWIWNPATRTCAGVP
eukprot:c14099_g1_i1 orf=73-1128(+)